MLDRIRSGYGQATTLMLYGLSTERINRELGTQKRVGLGRIKRMTGLQSGDLMAHYSLGYTLYELERYHEAYRHLRAYTELVPADGWAWCWLGKACEAMGELEEARSTYEKAIALDRDETDAPELLANLDKRHPR